MARSCAALPPRFLIRVLLLAVEPMEEVHREDEVEVEEEEAEAPAKEEAQDEGSQQIDDTSFDTRGELAEREWPSLVVLGVEGPALL